MNEALPDPALTPTPAPTPVERPAYVPEQFWDATANAVKADDFGKHVSDLAAFKAQSDEVAKDVPADPNGYRFELPADFKLEGVPEGTSIKFDDKDPRVGALKQIAHEHKLPQSVVSKLLTIEAQRIAADAIAEAAEVKKLGDKGTDRITAVDTFLKANLDPRTFESLRNAGDMRTAAAVETIEKLIEKITAGSIPGTPPVEKPAPAPKTFAERMYPDHPSGLPAASARSA